MCAMDAGMSRKTAANYLRQKVSWEPSRHRTLEGRARIRWMTMAAIDRLVHHSTILEFDGMSQRVKR